MRELLFALLLLVPAAADAAGIHPFIRYAYELDEYQGARVGENESALIVKGAPPVVLQRVLPEARFVFGVMNGNQRTTLTDVWLVVTFPHGASVRADGDWDVSIPHRAYFSLGAISAGAGIHADGHLWVTFPRSGEYAIGFEIYARETAPITRALRVRFE